MINHGVQINVFHNAAVSGTGGTTASLDIASFEGAIAIGVNARAGGTGTMTVTVEHSETGTGGWAAVPASALYALGTGQASAFPDVGTSAYSQKRGLQRQQLRRYLRVTFGGTGLSHNVACAVAYQPKYTEVE